MQPTMTTDEAIRTLRADPTYENLVRDAYLGPDAMDSARRFAASGEFAEVRRLLGARLSGATILDIGAGVGIASWAFAKAGACRAIALEPDPSREVGRGAMAPLAADAGFEIIAGVGEGLPLPDASVDIVFCRQVLHHASDLPAFLRECARVVRPGGIVLACREHVVDDDEQMREFLESHPVNRLAGGEGAHRLHEYIDAVADAGLKLDRVIAPWASVINAFPAVRSQAELEELPVRKLTRRIGSLARVAIHVPGVKRAIWRRIDRPIPGRMYSFVAHRPERPRP